MNVPAPVVEFAKLHGLNLVSMESEGIDWMLQLTSGPIEAKLVHFDDEDGTETTFEASDASSDTNEVFGYVDQDAIILQDVTEAPVLTEPGTMLRFDVQSRKTVDIGIGADDDGDLTIAFFGAEE